MVQGLAEAGVDVIKAWAGLTKEDYVAIVNTAHRHGIPVHAHLYDPESIWNALNAGVDVLQHVGSAGTPPFEARSPARDRGERSSPWCRPERTGSGCFPRRWPSPSDCRTLD